MVTDSGGAGRWRGGLGYTRTLLATQVPITGSQCSDRHEVKPWSLFGGQPGGNGGTLIQKGRQRGVADGQGALRQGLLEQVRQRPVRARRPDQAGHAGGRRLRRAARARSRADRGGSGQGYISPEVRRTASTRGPTEVRPAEPAAPAGSHERPWCIAVRPISAAGVELRPFARVERLGQAPRWTYVERGLRRPPERHPVLPGCRGGGRRLQRRGHAAPPLDVRQCRQRLGSGRPQSHAPHPGRC